MIHRPLIKLGILSCPRVLGQRALIEPEPLTLIVFQMDRGHHMEAGLQDGSHLHISLGQNLLLPHALIHVLERQNHIVSRALVAAEICDYGHIPVFIPHSKLAEHIQLLQALVSGRKQTFHGKALSELFPVLRMNLPDQPGLHDHIPHQCLGSPSLLAVSALPNQIDVSVL